MCLMLVHPQTQIHNLVRVCALARVHLCVRVRMRVRVRLRLRERECACSHECARAWVRVSKVFLSLCCCYTILLSFHLFWLVSLSHCLQTYGPLCRCYPLNTFSFLSVYFSRHCCASLVCRSVSDYSVSRDRRI